MLHIREAIVVEGRYDKNTLSQLVDTLILTTDGFAVFKNEERLTLLRRVAEQRGLIILTDSDGAGFVIRNFLKGAIPPHQLKQAYIPDISGKERRKRAPGKEGKLGVEGMRPPGTGAGPAPGGSHLSGPAAHHAAPAAPYQGRSLCRRALRQPGRRRKAPEAASAAGFCPAT